MATVLKVADLSVEPTGYNEEAERELVGRARELQPLLLQHAAYGDKHRTLHPDVFAALTDAGFWAMAAPRRWGGLGTSARAMSLVGAELAKADPSVGWVYTVLHGTTWVASLGPDELQEAIFGSSSEHPVICGIANPPGTMEEVDGGYVVNGRWPYASGSLHASWAQLGVNIRNPDGSVEHGGFAYLRREDYTIEDTWHMMGMKGTGSNTIVAKDVFIPKAQFYHVAKLGIGGHEAGKRHVGEPSDYWPFMPFLRATAHAVVAGAASAILDRVMEAAQKRPIIYTSYSRQAEAVMAQGEIGEAAARISAAVALTLKNCELIDQVGLTRVPMTPQQRAQSKGEGDLPPSEWPKICFRFCHEGGME
ncbi:acyl-CoA dehydrogenase family protein, partial [Novosphingobium indicum]|uniref:acyl-CoA dehydrogenase family protein n=1 Tax=Novosphingobium indicum TaxID=462949 RepID=UPI00166BA32E